MQASQTRPLESFAIGIAIAYSVGALLYAVWCTP